jgi:hypothetical protein
MKSDEPRRYFASYGVDASEDGVLKLGPAWTAITAPTLTASPTLADGALENWTTTTNLTSWTEALVGTGLIYKSSVFSKPVHGGTYSAQLYAPNGGDEARISQSMTWNAVYQSKRFSLSAWCYGVTQATVDKTRIRLYDGQTYTSASITTNGSWIRIAVNKTLASNASELTVIVECLHNAVNSTEMIVDDIVLEGYSLSGGNCYAEYDGLQYMSFGDCLYKANSATAPTSWTYVDQYGSIITGLCPAQVSGTSYLFVMIGSNQNGWYYDGAVIPAASTQMTDGGGTDAAGDFMVVATTTFYIAGRPTGVVTGGKCVLRTNTAPLAGAWSADVSVGATTSDITGLTTVNNVVYIAKEDSLWKVNSSGTTDMLIDYRLLSSSTSGIGVTGWNGKVYIPVGVNSLLEYDPDNGTYSNISPAATASSVTQAQIASAGAILSAIQTDFDGRIMAVTSGNEYLWVLQDNGSVNNLFKGQYANIDSVGWHWHPVGNTTMADVNCMAMSILTGAPIIWAAHGTGNPGYYNLATYTTSDPTYTYPMIITPFYTGGVWRMMKALYSIILGLESITATVYVTLQYRFYGTSAWSTPALTFDGASGTVTNGQDSNFMPTNSYGTAIQFRLNFISGSASSTPKVTRITGEGVIRPTEVTLYDFVARLVDDQLQNNGVRDGVLASRKLTALDNARANNWPVTFYDIDGNTRTVDILSRELDNWKREYGHNPTRDYHVLARKVTLA